MQYSGDTNYNLSLSSTQTVDGAGNSTAGASDLGVLSGTESIDGWVGSTDANDYYRFVLTGGSNVSLVLGGLSSDADLQLLNSSGGVITGSYHGGVADDSVSVSLGAGTYYARVLQYAGDTNYNLSISGTLSADGAGNSTAAAANLGILSGSESLNDWVGSSDTNDYYRFVLSGNTNVNLVLSGLSADADLQLLNGGGTVVAGSYNGGSMTDGVSASLTGGTYYARVMQYSGDTNYNLCISGTQINDGAGNATGGATDLGVLSGSLNQSDWVGSTDANDYYRFVLSSNANVNLVLGGLSADADLQLLDNGGGLIVGSYHGGATTDSVSTSLAAGTYYARVYQYSGNTNYNLSFSSTQTIDGAGNFTGGAADLGVLSGTLVQNDWVGSTDANDYYRFVVSGGSNVNLVLAGLSADADLQLLNSLGGLISGSYNGGAMIDSVSASLAAGTYYARVMQYSGDTNYNLSISSTGGGGSDGAGNTIVAASDLGTLSGAVSRDDWVGASDSNDYYRFVLSGSSNVSLVLSGLSADADLQLLNGSGGVVIGSYNGGSMLDSVSASLSAGTYYARVMQYAGDTNYNLALSSTQITDGAGNTTTGASDLGALSGILNRNDWVGSSDTDDYYRFVLSGSSNISLALGGLSADADLQLLDSGGIVIAGSYHGGTMVDSVNASLAAGTYYARVFQYSGDTNYNLSLSGTQSTDGAGNTTGAAADLGTLSGALSRNDWVGSTDTNDYYRFILSTDSNVSVLLGGLSADADLQLLNGGGTVIVGSYNGGAMADSVTTSLSAGTYYARVLQYAGDTNYNLSLSSTAQSIDGGGNTRIGATDLGVLSGSLVQNDWVGSGDANDYYRFVVTAASNVNLVLGGLSADADLQLLNGAGASISGSYNGGTLADSISASLAAGTYYARIYQYSGDTNYNLNISGTIVGGGNDSAGSTTTAASDLGALSGSLTRSDWVGSADANDYYRFVLSGSSNVNLVLGGLSADADLQLLDSTGSVVIGSYNGGSMVDAVSASLSTGTYYARVFQYSGDTNYNLSLSSTQSTDGAGNTTGAASDLGTLSGTLFRNDWVGSADVNDYYRFVLAAGSNVNLILGGLSADADLQLLDGAGALIGGSYNGGSMVDSVSASLSAGTYYARVLQYSGDTNYSLSLSGTQSADGAGNTTGSAEILGMLSGTLSQNDWVGSSDANDYYRFVISGSANISLVLGGLSADADLQLLNSNGTVIAGSYNGGTLADNVSSSLSAGTYYARVYQYSGDTNYNLSISGTSISDGAGNTTLAASDLGTLSGAVTQNDWVGSSDANDYYRFVLSGSSNVSLVLSGLSADADLQLLNGGGTVIIGSYNGGSSADSVSMSLGAGTYYARVMQYSGDTNYNLNISGTSVADGAGNTTGTASDLGMLSGTLSRNDWVGTTDANDYYRFVLTASSNVNLVLGGLSADADLQLLNGSGGLILGSYNGGAMVDSVSTSLSAGTYYARVLQYSGDTNYNLSLSSTQSADGAGNSTGSAADLGALSGSLYQNDWVGSGDANDYYRFVVSGGSNVSLVLGGLSADADLQLLNSGGTVISGSYNGGAMVDSVSASLAAGTYYALVYQYSGDTNYNLSISSTSVNDGGGNTMIAASDLGVLSGLVSRNDWVGAGDVNDYYRFVLSGSSNVSLVLSGLSADADLQLYSGTGSLIAGSYNGGSMVDSVSASLSAGTYYARVNQYYGDTNYNLSISGTSSTDGAGNSTTAASNIGTLSGTSVQNDWVGSSDTSDYYQFALSGSSNVNLVLSGLSADADLQLLDSSGSLVTGSYNGGTMTDSVSTALAAGTYYVRVFQYSGNTNYNLSFSSTQSTDGAGNTTGGASDLGVLSGALTRNDWVGSTDANDYYRFVLSAGSNVNLLLGGLSADADLQLLDSSGALITGSYNGGSMADSISTTLAAGTYYARVLQYSGDTNYTLNFSGTAQSVDGGGNTRLGATDLGALSGSLVQNDWVGSSDANDYYRFVVSGNSNVSLVLGGLSADADLQLLSSSGTVIAGSFNGGTTADSVSSSLSAGTYYARVYQYSGDTNYSLSISGTIIGTGSDSAGSSITTASDLGTLSGTLTRNDWVGSSDANDYYRFVLSGGSNVNLVLGGLSADADLQLLDSNGSSIMGSYNGDAMVDSVSVSLGAGTYYARVMQYSGDTNYNLSISGTSSNDGAGNTTGAASHLGALSGTVTRNDWVGSSDANDYYRFVLVGNANVNLVLSGLSADADLQLLDSSGVVITGSYNGGSTVDSISTSLSAGTYYARVFQYSGDTNYTLTGTATSVTDAGGNTTSLATDMGVLSCGMVRNDWVGSTDTNDYYRFVLAAGSNVSLVVGGLSSDADLQLLNSTGTVIIGSYSGGTSADSITTSLSAGTYYARVFQYSGDTNYTLNISGTSTTDGAGNTTGTAADLGTLSGTSVQNDWVGASDTNDYYRFVVSGSSNVSLVLSGLSADADLQLLNGSGALVMGSYNAGTSADSVSLSLSAGTYYARVLQYSGDTNYNLSISGTSVTDGAGNTTGTSSDLGILSGSVVRNDWVGSGDINDYYRFVLTASSNINLMLGGLSADADLQLLDGTGSVIVGSFNGGSAVDSIGTSLGAGTYYARVYQYSGDTNYTLSLSGTQSVDGAGNTTGGGQIWACLPGH